MPLWTPSLLPNVTGWWDASAPETLSLSGSAVTAWTGRDPLAKVISQATSASQPVYDSVGLDGYPCVVFDGVADYLFMTQSLGLWDAGSMTVSAAASVNGATPSTSWYSEGHSSSSMPYYTTGQVANVANAMTYGTVRADSGTTVLGLTAFSPTSILPFDNTRRVFSVRDTGSAVTGFRDGHGSSTVSYSRQGHILTVNRFSLGSRLIAAGPSLYVPMRVGELVFVAPGLSSLDRQRLEGYLAWKWGTQANLPSYHFFKNAPPQDEGRPVVLSPLVRASDSRDVFTDTIRDVFLASGTWTKRPGLKAVTVVCIGGGGAGGSGRRSAVGSPAVGGGGGGGGGWSECTFPAALLGDTESVVVGAGGVGGAGHALDSTSGQAGGAGGVSSFGSLLTVTAASGGAAGTGAGSASVPGGSGDIQSPGGGSTSATGNGSSGNRGFGVVPGSGGGAYNITSSEALTFFGGVGGDSGTGTDNTNDAMAGTRNSFGRGGDGGSRSPGDYRGGGGGAGGARGTTVRGAAFVSADFTVSSDTAVESYAPEMGGALVMHPAYFPATIEAAADRVRSNSDNRAAYYATAEPSSADYEVEIVARVESVGASLTNPGVILRMDTTADTMYKFHYDASLGTFYIAREVNGSAANIVSAKLPMPLNTDFTMSFSCYGTYLMGRVNGDQFISATDTSITAAGRAGFTVRSQATVDSFRAYAVTAFTLQGHRGGDGGFPGGGAGGGGPSRDQGVVYEVQNPFLSASFTVGADSAPEDYTPEIGGAFHTVANPSFPAVILASEGRIRGSHTNTISFAASTTVAPSADCSIKAKLSWSGTASAGAGVPGVFFRSNEDGSTLYRLFYAEATTRFLLEKSVAGVFTSLANYTYTLASGDTVEILVIVSGPFIQVVLPSQSNQTIISVADSSITAAGKVGAMVRVNGRVDDLVAGDPIGGSITSGRGGNGGDGTVIVDSHF